MTSTRATTLVLIGPHGAGKTTLGRRLAELLGWRFDDELGERLRRQALANDPTAHAQLRQDLFDHQVLQQELARDAIRGTLGDSRVIETWHVGNLAYAQLRSPEVAAQFWHDTSMAIQRAGDQTNVLIQPLRVDETTLRKRQSEPGPPDIARFFLDVAARAEHLARQFRLTIAEPLYTDRVDLDSAVRIALRQIHG